MMFDIITALGCGGAGLCLGWVMHALHRSGVAASEANEKLAASRPVAKKQGQQTPAAPKKAVAATIPPEKLSAVAGRIRSFAAMLAASVDAHQSRVERVSSTLIASDLSGAPPVILDAVEELLSANENMRAQLQSSQERLREQSKQLQSAEQRAQTDALTQLANRGVFDERLQRQYAKGLTRSGTLILLDIDHFKVFNDEHGHRYGDEVLRQVARMLEARLEPYGLVSRFGGEEFSVLIGDTDFAEAIDLVEQTRIAIGSRDIRFEDKRFRVTLSVGIGHVQAEQSMDEWLQNVDDALYRSKEAGRDCSHYVDGRRFVRVGKLDPVEAVTAVAVEQPIAAIPSNLLDLETTGNSLERGLPTADAESAIQAELSSLSGQVSNAVGGDFDTDEADDESSEIEQFTASLNQDDQMPPPKALSYLPDRESMIDGIMETMVATRSTARPDRLMAVTLSGHPGGATMRSLLQLVRAAMRSQDRIGCLNHSTLLICMPECDSEESRRRAEQICSAAGSIGVPLASTQKANQGERLSIGIMELASENVQDWNVASINQAIDQTRAVAMLAAQHGNSEQADTQAKLPISSQKCGVNAGKVSLHSLA